MSTRNHKTGTLSQTNAPRCPHDYRGATDQATAEKLARVGNRRTSTAGTLGLPCIKTTAP